jgi:hypothetical protein
MPHAFEIDEAHGDQPYRPQGDFERVDPLAVYAVVDLSSRPRRVVARGLLRADAARIAAGLDLLDETLECASSSALQKALG